jgi:hypothetical protein
MMHDWPGFAGRGKQSGQRWLYSPTAGIRRRSVRQLLRKYDASAQPLSECTERCIKGARNALYSARE